MLSFLSWNIHNGNILSKANWSLGFFKRNFNCAPTILKRLTYVTLVRPILEYASSIWSPHLNCLTSSIEALQNRAARFILSDYSGNTSVTNPKVEGWKLCWLLLSAVLQQTEGYPRGDLHFPEVRRPSSPLGWDHLGPKSIIISKSNRNVFIFRIIGGPRDKRAPPCSQPTSAIPQYSYMSNVAPF